MSKNIAKIDILVPHVDAIDRSPGTCRFFALLSTCLGNRSIASTGLGNLSIRPGLFDTSRRRVDTPDTCAAGEFTRKMHEKRRNSAFLRRTSGKKTHW